jgi:UDP-glucuronate decarboxylase
MNINDGRVVSNFIVQALKGEDITVFGNGQHTRSFQYIDDLIEGMIKMMDTPEDFTGPVNLGCPDEVTITELAKRIISITGSGSGIIYLPLPQDDPRQRKPDIELAVRKLDWYPKTDLMTGLENTVAYFREKLKESVVG